MEDTSALGRAVAMVKDLRVRCSWDRVQTRDTLRPYLIEEAHELERALGSDDPVAIRHEVADLLLHLAWQLVLAEEKGEWTADQVADDLESKMKRRHPHLFDLGPKQSWEQLKKKERAGRVLDGLPPTLPDLLMAQRLQERAAGVGFDWPDAKGPADKVREELAEVEAETSPERLDHEIGDLLFSVVNLARKVGVHPGPALDRANHRFTNRFRIVEHLASARGIEMQRVELSELDALWEEAKTERG